MFKQYEIEFDPHDIWIGVIWKRWPCAIEFKISFIPMVVVRLYFQWQ